MKKELFDINEKLKTIDKTHFYYNCKAFYQSDMFVLKRNEELVMASKSIKTIKIQIGFKYKINTLTYNK